MIGEINKLNMVITSRFTPSSISLSRIKLSVENPIYLKSKKLFVICIKNN